MKSILRYIAILFLLFSLNMLSAQDIIVTKSSSSIKAKVTEVSDEAIRYFEYDKQTGPVFIIKTDAVSSIVFENGSVKLFETAAKHEEPRVVYIERDENIVDPSVQLVEIDKNTYMIGDKKMTTAETADFLSKNSPAAFNEFAAGLHKKKVGVALLGSGIAVSACGIVFLSIGYGAGYQGFSVAGYMCDVAGTGLWAASIPMLVRGGYNKTHAVEIYNAQCAVRQQKSDVGLNFNVAPTAVGLTLSF